MKKKTIELYLNLYLLFFYDLAKKKEDFLSNLKTSCKTQLVPVLIKLVQRLPYKVSEETRHNI